MCTHPRLVKNSVGAQAVGWYKYIRVPCGHCPECIALKREDWAQRVKHELRAFRKVYKPFDGFRLPEAFVDVPANRRGFAYPPKNEDDFSRCDSSNYAWFFTLTYDDEHLPEGEVVCSFSCVWHNCLVRGKHCHQSFRTHNLRYKDVTEWLHTAFKRRKRLGLPAVSYLGCGEYGFHNTRRPHYHLLLIGLSLTDAYRLSYQWQKKHAPSALKYTNNPFVQKDTESEFRTLLSTDLNHASNARQLCRMDKSRRLRAFEIGADFTAVNPSDTTAGSVGGYIAKYIVKGGHLSKMFPNLVPERTLVTEGFGLGYKPLSGGGHKSAKIRRVEELRKVYIPADLQKKLQKGVYNSKSLHIFDANFKWTEPNPLGGRPFPKTLNRYEQNQIIGRPNYHKWTDSQGFSHRERLYPEFVPEGQEIPAYYSLRDALSVFRSRKADEGLRLAYESWCLERSLESSDADTFSMYVRASYSEQQSSAYRKGTKFRTAERINKESSVF